MRRMLMSTLLLLMLLILNPGLVALAQNTTTTSATPPPSLTISTAYPSQVSGIGETVTLNLKLRAPNASTVQLDLKDPPANWTATFRGANRIVQAVYVEPDSDATVDLRLEPSAEVKAGTYNFTVVAKANGSEAQLPITLTVKEKLPPKLSFSVDLPTLRGKPSTTFRYDVTLKNEGDEDLTVNVAAEAPPNFQITYSLNGQEVTDFPLPANESRRLSVEAKPLTDNMEANTYQITLHAQGGSANATTQLAAEVTGQATLTVTAPDGRLSGDAYAGVETPVKIIVRNDGSAPVRGVDLSASTPNGWAVTFDPAKIEEIAAGQQSEVTAKVKPLDKAVAGDYMVNLTARSQDGASKSVDYRITVRTSTLWGVVGIALIAVAVGVVALAVGRFGRR